MLALRLSPDVEKRLDAHFGPDGCCSGKTPTTATISKSSAPTRRIQDERDEAGISCDAAAGLVPLPEESKHWQRTKGVLHNLADRESLAPAQQMVGEARDALNELEAWATNPDGSPFFALLGEVGIGKTTTLKQLTRQLLEKRKADPKKFPLPIYIDLRDFVGETPGAVP